MIEPGNPRAPFYRLSFALAAAYHVAFATWAVLMPASFLKLFAIDPRYQTLLKCLGMAVGVCGLAYAYAALRLDRVFWFIALCLVGKVVGAVGWAALVRAGALPIRTFPLVLFDDIVWCLPFGLFLLEGIPAGARVRASAPWLCALLNLAAAIAMPLALAPGTEMVPDPAARVEYIAAHPWLWRAGWCLWIASAMSLLGFFAWWAARVRSRALAMPALLVAIVGIGGDLFGESLYIGWLPADYQRVAPLARLLTGAWGNTLYTLAGILLTIGSPWIAGAARICAWAIWTAGLALGAFSLAGQTMGMAVSMALLFILFCPWAAWIGFLSSTVDRRPIR